MRQETTFAESFWTRVDEMRARVFSQDDLDLLEMIKPLDRYEERLARL